MGLAAPAFVVEPAPPPSEAKMPRERREDPAVAFESKLDRPVVKPHFHKKDVHLTEFQKWRNNFISGALALSTSYAVMHPLDTLKTRMQAQAGTGKGSGISFRAMFTRETMRMLSKGFTTSILGAAGQGGLRLSTYEFTKAHMLRWSAAHFPSSTSSAGPSPAISAIAAIFGDLASSIVKVPREIITTRLQTDYMGDGRASASKVFRDILKEDGPLGLFRGFWSTTARDAPFMVILFVVYESFKGYSIRNNIGVTVAPGSIGGSRNGNGDYISSLEADDSAAPATGITTFRSILYGGISGFLAGYVTTPFDVVRAKVMTYKKKDPRAPAPGMTTVFREVAEAARARGDSVTRVFFTGALARSFWWYCVCSSFFAIYERMRQVLQVV
ncbi:mitochondrial carrier domain-containing protein [Hyaloraphidium curvatum]|nr:mitochondrial carrier domain-containing protein [Hyaloraphidium curvatum]